MNLEPLLSENIPRELRNQTAVLAERYRTACTETKGANVASSTATVLKAFAASPFIANYAIRWPKTFQDIIASPEINQARNLQDFSNMLSTALDGVSDLPEAQSILRRLRARELMRIAWRDIVLHTAIETVMSELSDFADETLSQAVRWLQDLVAPKLGRPFAPDGSMMRLLVLGLGKLGGGELNFSSDVDLMLVYSREGKTRGGRKELEHQEYFDRIGRELITLLNETTADGFVFRVDLRLRPFGESGSLTSSLNALEQYYASHGRDWERYALIKARVIYGDKEAQDSLRTIIRPFVFRRYLDYGAVEALREMKALIDREGRSDILENDLKRGYGGIREIEFIGQLFQLTRGGHEAQLRNRSILPTLETLSALSLLEASKVTQLQTAYRLLRKTEHRLQQVADQQTHTLPRGEQERTRLTFALGYTSWDALHSEIAAHRAVTSSLFKSLLQEPTPLQPQYSGTSAVWRDLWLGLEDKESARNFAAKNGILLGELQLRLILELKSTRFRSRLSKHGHKRFDRLIPRLLETAHAGKIRPETYTRLENLIHAISRRSVYASFLTDNPDALDRLIKLFDASPWIAEQVTLYPILMDELLDARALYDSPNKSQLFMLADKQTATDNLERDMEGLRSFKNRQTLHVAANDVTSHIPIAETSTQLTLIAEACLSTALKIARRDLEARYGEPRCVEHGVERRPGFAIIGYGKLGGLELGYGSDLDLVFIHDSGGNQQETNGGKTIENSVFFTRLAQRLIHVLGTKTPSGSAYEIDVRLRPSGTSGLLISSAEAFDAYQTESAWDWEHQALVRARSIAGDIGVMGTFDEIRNRTLARPRDEHKLKSGIRDMRDRMRQERNYTDPLSFDLKHGAGGITDIEFMVQYIVLRWACTYPSLLALTNNFRLLETIAELGLLPTAQCRRLREAYVALRAGVHQRALQRTKGCPDKSDMQNCRDAVITIWNGVFS